jgi:hypothetical protein
MPKKGGKLMKKSPKKSPNVHPIRDEADPEPPEEHGAPEPAPEPAAEAGAPRPAFKKRDPALRHMTFFDRIASIEAADWGTRAKIKIYRLDPIIDRTRGSEHKFVAIYHEPIDENKIKIDHGSGRYRLYLNLKTAGERVEREVDSVEIDVLDPAFPPKIPAGEWVDDPRNKKWAWARPAGAPGSPPEPPQQTPASAASAFTDAIKAYSEIRKDVKQEVAVPAPTADPNPVSTALSMAKDLLQMRADNPMVDVMKDELKAMRDEIAAERAENRKLQAEMRQQQNSQPQKNGVQTLKEVLAEVKEFVPTVKELLPQVGETVRAGRTTWLDIIRESAPTVLDKLGQVGVMLAARPMQAYQPATVPAAAPGLPAPAANGTAPNPAMQQPMSSDQKVLLLMQQPLVLSAFRNYFEGATATPPRTSGGDFAEWLSDAVGDGPLKDLRGMGRDRVMQLLKSHPAWPMMAPQEPQLIEFVDQILAWQPTEEEEDEEEGVDLTQGV